MDTLISVVTKISEVRHEEDIVDRLNYKYTSYLFSFGALLIMSKLYLSTPISCWTPAEFKKGWIEYTRDFCLIENTYYVPLDDSRLPSTTQRENSEIPYYQWVQFVLILLAFCFYLPHIFWRSVNWQSGVQVRSIVQAATTLGIDEKKRAEEIKKVARHIQVAFKRTSRGVANKSNPFILLFGTCFGDKFLSYMYLFTKALFLLNIIFQMTILHVFLGFTPLNFYHLKLGFNTNWKETGLFPRSTMCDFEVRTKGNIQRYSVQCVLQLNMFNEKLFVVFYYWLMILFTITLTNMMYWIVKLFNDDKRVDFGKRMLKSAGIDDPTRGQSKSPDPHKRDGDSIELKKLTSDDGDYQQMKHNNYESFCQLSSDEVLLLRLISSNAGDIVASDITAALFKQTGEQ